MANYKLAFIGTEKSNTDSIELECYTTKEYEVCILLEDTECDHQYNLQQICLDKSTAIKFAKTLRTEINKIKEV